MMFGSDLWLPALLLPMLRTLPALPNRNCSSIPSFACKHTLAQSLNDSITQINIQKHSGTELKYSLAEILILAQNTQLLTYPLVQKLKYSLNDVNAHLLTYSTVQILSY
jgi:hypothetical protein